MARASWLNTGGGASLVSVTPSRELRSQLGEERHRHAVRVVHAEAVDIELLHPQGHDVDRVRAELQVRPVELRDPEKLGHGLRGAVHGLVQGGVLRDQRAVPRGVVRDPVDDDVHPQLVRGLHEIHEVGGASMP